MAKSLLMILFSIILAVSGQLLLKSGMTEIGRITLEDFRDGNTALAVATNFQVVFGLTLYFLSAVVWLVVLSREDLSFAYPLLGSSYIVILFASRVLFQEPVSAVRWAGAVCISLGVLLITRS